MHTDFTMDDTNFGRTYLNCDSFFTLFFSSRFFLTICTTTQTYFIRRFEKNKILSTSNWNFVNKLDWRFNFDFNFMFDTFFVRMSIDCPQNGWEFRCRCVFMCIDIIWLFTHLERKTNQSSNQTFTRFSWQNWYVVRCAILQINHLSVCIFFFAWAHFHSRKKKIIFHIVVEKNSIKTYFSTGYFIADSFHYFAVVFNSFPYTDFNSHEPFAACPWFQQKQLKLSK